MRAKKIWILVIAVVLALFVLSRLPTWLFGATVETWPVTRGALLASVVATGRIESPSRVTIGSEIVGTLAERSVGEGDRVSQGQIIARLDNASALAGVREAQAALDQIKTRDRPLAQANLRQAQAQLAQAEREAKRQRELVARALVSAEQNERAEEALAVARAQAASARTSAQAVAAGGSDEALLTQRLASAQAALDKTQIRSRIDGVVLNRLAEPGDVIGAGRGIVEVARDGITEIVAQVDERNLASLALGQAALASADAYPDRRFNAQMSFIAPAIDAQTGTVEVRLRVPEPPPELRQDMTVSVDIETGRANDALLLPSDSLREASGDRAKVLVVRDGRVTAVPVRLGLKGLGTVQVLDGLVEGDAVLPGAAEIATGTRVRAKTSADAAVNPAALDPSAMDPAASDPAAPGG